MKKELILCFDKEQALALAEIAGNKSYTFLKLSHQLDKYFIPRYIAETSNELIHPIPYFLIQNQNGEVLLYQRGKGVGESRLAGNHSIGFGGHVELEKDGLTRHTDSKFNSIEDCILSAIENELDEELDTQLFPESFEYLDIIYDDSDEVGKVHLGITCKFVVKEAKIREAELLNCGWHTVDELKRMQEAGVINLESWSNILLNSID